ncbi:hypothetical protein ACFRMN_11380 [Streptomyces sp. NPDC056835]|uniref:hypothetical protein n=1 Tax=Streptomyces sp. NPDC056835 TaxID=3345956 RepID=UPI0036B7BC88
MSKLAISEYGRPAAALVSVAELEELRGIRDEVDVAELEARKAEPTGPGVTHDEFMAQLEVPSHDLVPPISSGGRPRRLIRQLVVPTVSGAG